MAQIRVGISGWTYPPWRGNFYPRGLNQKHELAYAGRRFSALEINGTFYSLQRPSSFKTWYDQTPPDFVFALKAPRYITHMLRLRNCEVPLANFLASGVLALRDKLGPILWQFPANFQFDAARFSDFFSALPRDTEAAARIAVGYNNKLKVAPYLDVDRSRPIRYAVEIRHPSFMTPAFISLARKLKLAVVVADTAGKFPVIQDVTADWLYIRLHGSRVLYRSGYSPREIGEWAQRVRTWANGGEPRDARRVAPSAPPPRKARDIFVFFDNTDVKLRAPVDARRMLKELDIAPPGTPRQIMAFLESQPAMKRPVL